MRDLATVPGRDGDAPREGRYPNNASTIWRWVRRGEFPQPVKLAGGTTAWPVDAIEAWEASKGYAPNIDGTTRAAAVSAARRGRDRQC